MVMIQCLLNQQRLGGFSTFLMIYEVDVYQTNRRRITYPFLIFADALVSSEAIAIIYGRDPAEIKQKFIDIYNNDIFESPLYDTIDQIVHRHKDDPCFVEPLKPIDVNDFWQDIETCLWKSPDIDFTATIKIYPVIVI